MSTNPIEQTAGLPLRTQLSVSEVQAFLEASLDPAPMTFSQLINQQLALPVAASRLIFGFFYYVLQIYCCLHVSSVLAADEPRGNR